jgi:hypothetical protein
LIGVSRMKDFIPINKIFKRMRRKNLTTWIDKLTFPRILLLWILIVVIFGFIYYFLTDKGSFLLYNLQDKVVDKVIDSIYFSFVTATTTGFGDIIPFGLFKILAIFEVVLGLLLLAIVTSKLISIKQNAILDELYELSFNEKINRLRSSLVLFRQNLSRIIIKIEEDKVRKREISDIYIYISSFEDVLSESSTLMGKKDAHYFKKVIDPLNTELIFNSILSSFEKLHELMAVMNQGKIDWKRSINLNLIENCIKLNENLFSNLNSSKGMLEEDIVAELNSRKKEIIDKINKEVA